MKGAALMDKDPLCRLYELYCESIVEQAREEASRFYLAQIEELTFNTLTFENNKLKLLLDQYHIAY